MPGINPKSEMRPRVSFWSQKVLFRHCKVYHTSAFGRVQGQFRCTRSAAVAKPHYDGALLSMRPAPRLQARSRAFLRWQPFPTFRQQTTACTVIGSWAEVADCGSVRGMGSSSKFRGDSTSCSIALTFANSVSPFLRGRVGQDGAGLAAETYSSASPGSMPKTGLGGTLLSKKEVRPGQGRKSTIARSLSTTCTYNTRGGTAWLTLASGNSSRLHLSTLG